MLRPLARFVGGVVEGLFGRAERPVRARAQPRRRWLLEALEDRLAPANFTVNDDRSGSFGAGNAGTLRYCIDNANTIAGPHTVTIQNTVTTISLEAALPPLARDISIIGHGEAALTISRAVGAPQFRIFEIGSSYTCSLSDLTATGGQTAANLSGGGILNNGILTLTNVTVSGCSAGAAGGGIYNTGTLTGINLNIAGNNANAAFFGRGGGLCNDGTATLKSGSTVTGNTADYGGGLYNAANRSLTVEGGTTVTFNNGVSAGGGVGNEGVFTMTGGAINANSTGPAGDGGGFASLHSGAQAHLKEVTLSFNEASRNGGAFYLSSGAVTVEDCVANGNTAIRGALAYRKVSATFTMLGNTNGLEGTVEVGP